MNNKLHKPLHFWGENGSRNNQINEKKLQRQMIFESTIFKCYEDFKKGYLYAELAY